MSCAKQEDINYILSDEKFANVRSLIQVKGRTFSKIDDTAFNDAMKDMSLTNDEKAYISMTKNVINSKKIFKVEYVEGDYASLSGSAAIANSLPSYIGDKILNQEGYVNALIIDNYGGGLNVSIFNGSHSMIRRFTQSERIWTSMHEVLGHGIPSAKGMSKAENNANAIRTENLVRRLIGLPQTDGSAHGGYEEGHIIEPYALPILEL